MSRKRVSVSFVTDVDTKEIIALLELLDRADELSIHAETLPDDAPTEADQIIAISDPRLVYRITGPGYRVIDIDATLKRLGLTEEQLNARQWPQGSVENSVKRAIARQKIAG